MSQTIPLTILFADVSGSTKLFETRGDLEARRLVAAILGALSEVTARHGGRVIKTIGDEIMCTFPGPMQGLLCAVDMQKRIAHDPNFAKDKLAIRVGLHHGETLVEENDVYGDAVNTAARMASLAKREQIITTASTVNMLTNVGMLHTRAVGQARVAGKQHPIDIVDVQWQEDTSNVTMVQRAIRLDAGGQPAAARLLLRYRGQVLELDALSPPFTLGRDAASSLCVDAEWVSRNHALIEYKRGYFMISDRSTNGTWVKLGDDDELRLHRDEVHLRKTGSISLGQTVGLNPDHVVYFQCGE
ncbi:MAG: adenylate/guanylate cyclase domain-containing protein [Proteobacteria bacterium]|nr:adenylate/guanylate cyclase domain-containing protein [Pseudomonadota bacterium]